MMFKDYGETKYQRLATFAKTGDFQVFFLGDNGQGDVVTATRVVEDKELSKRLGGIFIHEVTDRENIDPLNTDPRVIYYNNVIDLTSTINESPIPVTFSDFERQSIEQAFLDEFMDYANSPKTNKESQQFANDLVTFNMLSSKHRIHNMSFIGMTPLLPISK